MSSAHASRWLARKVLPRPILCRRRGRLRLRARKTKRAMQGESLVRAQRVCEGNCEGFLGFFLGFPDRRLKRCPKNAVWVGLRRFVSCSEDEKGVQGGSGAYMNQVQRFSRGISGLVVECIVAIDVTRVRFPADAHCSHELVGAGKAVR